MNANGSAWAQQTGEFGVGGFADRADHEPTFLYGQARTEAAFLLNEAPTETITDANGNSYRASVAATFMGSNGQEYTLRLALELDKHGAPYGNYGLIRDNVFDSPILRFTRSGDPLILSPDSDQIIGDEISLEDNVILAEQIEFIGDRGRMALADVKEKRHESSTRRQRIVRKLGGWVAALAVVGGGLRFGLPEAADIWRDKSRIDASAQAAQRKEDAADKIVEANKKKAAKEAADAKAQDKQNRAKADIQAFDNTAPDLDEAAAVEPGGQALVGADANFEGLAVPTLKDPLAIEGFVNGEGVREFAAPKAGQCEVVTLPLPDGASANNVAVAHNGATSDMLTVRLPASGKALQICGLGQISQGRVEKGQQAGTIYVQIVSDTAQPR